jgi:hypothetical protein
MGIFTLFPSNDIHAMRDDRQAILSLFPNFKHAVPSVSLILQPNFCALPISYLLIRNPNNQYKTPSEDHRSRESNRGSVYIYASFAGG